MGESILLSIIIPVYNGESFISDTLSSLIDIFSECDEVEIIVVNDGSNDKTESIIKDYSDKYNIIHQINQANAGVSAARNAGIAASKGKYLYFMDADDYLSKEFYKVLKPIICTGMNDAIVFGFNMIKKGKKKKHLPNCKCWSLIEAYMRGFIRMGIWTLVTRRDIIERNNLGFDTRTRYGEDLEMIIKVLVYAKSVCVVKQPLYNYVKDNPGSAMNRPFNLERLSSIESKYRIIDVLKKTGKKTSIVKSAVNFLIADYNLLLTRNILPHDCKQVVVERYGGIEKMLPPFQISKFYLFNLRCYLKRKNSSKISVHN